MWKCKCDNVNPSTAIRCLKCNTAKSTISSSSAGNNQRRSEDDGFYVNDICIETPSNHAEPSRDSSWNSPSYSSNSDSNSSSSYDSSSSSSD